MLTRRWRIWLSRRLFDGGDGEGSEGCGEDRAWFGTWFTGLTEKSARQRRYTFDQAALHACGILAPGCLSQERPNLRDFGTGLRD
jgi:hypothetical protein